MPSILTRGRIVKGPALRWDSLGRPYVDVTLALDYLDDLRLFMQQSPADQAITFDTAAEQPELFVSP